MTALGVALGQHLCTGVLPFPVRWAAQSLDGVAWLDYCILGHSLETQKFPVAWLAGEEVRALGSKSQHHYIPTGRAAKTPVFRFFPMGFHVCACAGRTRQQQGLCTSSHTRDLEVTMLPSLILALLWGRDRAHFFSLACLIFLLWCLMFTCSVTRSTMAFALALSSLAMGRASSGTIRSFQIRKLAFISCTTEIPL